MPETRNWAAGEHLSDLLAEIIAHGLLPPPRGRGWVQITGGRIDPGSGASRRAHPRTDREIVLGWTTPMTFHRGRGADGCRTEQPTTSTSPADLVTAGPAVVSQNTNGVHAYCGAAVSGATTIGADADSSARVAFLRAAAVNQEASATRVSMGTGLTAGSNTFTVKYYSPSITVLPL